MSFCENCGGIVGSLAICYECGLCALCGHFICICDAEEEERLRKFDEGDEEEVDNGYGFPEDGYPPGYWALFS